MLPADESVWADTLKFSEHIKNIFKNDYENINLKINRTIIYIFTITNDLAGYVHC